MQGNGRGNEIAGNRCEGSYRTEVEVSEGQPPCSRGQRFTSSNGKAGELVRSVLGRSNRCRGGRRTMRAGTGERR